MGKARMRLRSHGKWVIVAMLLTIEMIESGTTSHQNGIQVIKDFILLGTNNYE